MNGIVGVYDTVFHEQKPINTKIEGCQTTMRVCIRYQAPGTEHEPGILTNEVHVLVLLL